MMFAAAAVTAVRTIYVLAFCIVSNACYSRGTTTQIHAQNTIHFGPGPGPVQANQAGPNLKRRTAAYKSGVLHSAAIYHEPERVNSGLQVSNNAEAVTQWERVETELRIWRFIIYSLNFKDKLVVIIKNIKLSNNLSCKYKKQYI